MGRCMQGLAGKRAGSPMKLIDITRTIQEAPIYPGSAPFSLTPLTVIDKTEEFNITMLQGDSHLGTHVDAPRHAYADGTTIDQTDLALYYGACRVATVPFGCLLTSTDLEPLLTDCSRLLLKSNGTSHLTLEAASALAQHHLRLLGTDGLSAAPMDCEGPIHRLLLRHGIALLENLQLEHVPDGDYILCAFPLKVAQGDGSPVRAVLLCEN